MPNIPWRSLPAGVLKVIQLSDTHLYADPTQQMREINTLDSLQCVISHALRHHGPFDFALVTGDLAQNAEIAAYQHLVEQLHRLACPAYCLPGNHDDPAKMRECLQSAWVSTPKVVGRGAWRIILLDSVVPGESGGHLAADELALLQGALTQPHPTLVALHHQPVPVGSWSIDQMALDNADELFECLDEATHVHGVIWGHVHQAFEQMRNHLRLMACPSTCLQFKPDGFDAKNASLLQPGYRLLALWPDGGINTEVIRVE